MLGTQEGHRHMEPLQSSEAPGRRLVLGTVVASLSLLGLLAQDALASDEEARVRILLVFAGATMTATLYDNPSARDFASMLPLALTIDDYLTNEKIAYLPRKLTEEGSGPFDNERPGDLGYYAPWGNLALFHGSYRYSGGLFRLGRIEGDIAPLLIRGKCDLHIERMK
jgi:hypothetical protein